MSLPLFYITEYDSTEQLIKLEEDTSRHIVQVLRMGKGKSIQLTNGKGVLLTAEIMDDHKKHCLVSVRETAVAMPSSRKVSIGISLVKNASRFEWFVEKATEIGVHEIIPLLCERTEKEKFRMDRLTMVCISAMLQSRQLWLPIIHQPIAFDLVFRQQEIAAIEQKFIAHCMDAENKTVIIGGNKMNSSAVILIGPEGDFTPAEIDMAIHHQFQPVSLGKTRLRTETAGIVAATLLSAQ